MPFDPRPELAAAVERFLADIQRAGQAHLARERDRLVGAFGASRTGAEVRAPAPVHASTAVPAAAGAPQRAKAGRSPAASSPAPGQPARDRAVPAAAPAAPAAGQRQAPRAAARSRPAATEVPAAAPAPAAHAQPAASAASAAETELAQPAAAATPANPAGPASATIAPPPAAATEPGAREPATQLPPAPDCDQAPQRYRGVVQWFGDRGYGFIHGEDGRDVFVHRSAIGRGMFPRLTAGQLVEYEVQETAKGLQAVAVTALQGSAQRGR